MVQAHDYQHIIQQAQQFLAQEQLSGWLIYDYRHSNPIFRQVVTPLRSCDPPLLSLHTRLRASPTADASRGRRKVRCRRSRGNG